ncbi:M15 family metallopeptidase [Streptomyces sp. DSM 44917]|uniref:M15 family metallopeptidase n=1 Tax=Streptomyces boetiae TaxID=3075541 RepID=A0ABU2L612_9ACTN|nr:M15 family metallopeptidase [Streptomyces sp. DSM 44917]MDT0306960.1 M15 family metallopeptidase [Streptomyces sp. DSM 44917]
MSLSAARPKSRRNAGFIAGGLAAAILGILVQQSASSPAPSSGDLARGGPESAAPGTGEPIAAPPALGEDGSLPEGVTPFEDRYPGVARLDPELLRALRAAAADAAAEGVRLQVNSGWRSPAYQDRLLREAVAEYGSQEEAARWVATADTSPHVSGDAVDIGPSGSAQWLAGHGAAYGLCLVYRNEPWHFELRPEASGGECPRLYADPTEDPRMRR